MVATNKTKDDFHCRNNPQKTTFIVATKDDYHVASKPRITKRLLNRNARWRQRQNFIPHSYKRNNERTKSSATTPSGTRETNDKLCIQQATVKWKQWGEVSLLRHKPWIARSTNSLSWRKTWIERFSQRNEPTKYRSDTQSRFNKSQQQSIPNQEKVMSIYMMTNHRSDRGQQHCHDTRNPRFSWNQQQEMVWQHGGW